MFYRAIIEDLKKWKHSEIRKPLVLRGARQVGKTTVVEQFSKEFTQFISLNLEKYDDKEIFATNKSISEIVDALFFIKNKSKNVNDTLIFIDEIQEHRYVISMLRYFYEEYPQYYVIAAGSLLETVFDNTINYPVGRVEYKFMYPFSFAEFINALGEEQALLQYYNIPVADFAHDKLLKLFNLYTLIGGMPEVVKNYVKNRDIVLLKPIYESLLMSYIDDIEKYARNATLVKVIRHAVQTIFIEAGSRIKFAGFGASAYSSKEMGESLRIIEKARLLYLIYPTVQTSMPFAKDLKKSPRLQVLDTGLLNYFSGIQKDIFKIDNLLDTYKGKIAEHIAGQELMANSNSLFFSLLFWVRNKKDSMAEIDFLYKYNATAIPIEVKSGKIGKLKSLLQYIDLSDIDFAVRIYAGKFNIEKHKTLKGKEFTLMNLPYYLTGNIHNYIKKYYKTEL